MAECKTPIHTGTPGRTSKYVLVAGSDANNLVYTSMLLQQLGYHVCSVSSAEEALEMAGVAVPSLIITDLKLRGMNAPQLINSLRQKPSTAAVPVIIKTDHLTPQVEEKCREAGAATCLNKPVEPEALYRAVQAAVEPYPREHIRIKTRMLVTLNNEPGEVVEGDCITMLSSRGMYVRTLKRYTVKSKLPVRITLDEKQISVEAKVIYNHDIGEGPFGEPGIGLYFTAIKPEDQERLQLYINDEVTKGIVRERQ